MSTVQLAKVTVLGDGGVGKTSLLRAIRGIPFDSTPATLVTELLRVPTFDADRSNAPSEDGAGRQFVFWDTPGQGLALDYKHAMMNCHAALVVVRSEYFAGFETAPAHVEMMQRSCPSAPRLLVALQSRRGPSRFGSEQLKRVAEKLAFTTALEVNLDDRGQLDGLLTSLEACISWEDVPQLPARLLAIRIELLRALSRESAVSASRIQGLITPSGLETHEVRDVVNGLCDTGDVVVVANREGDSLYMTFERWSREVELLDRRARASRTQDGRIPFRAMMNDDKVSSIEARIQDAVVAQLVEAGHYILVEGDLIFRRASRLSQPVVCFISHSSSENKIAELIARVLKSRNIDVWLDAWKIKPGDSIVSRIEEGLEKATTVLALLSCDSVRSPWVQEELRMAVYRRVVDAGFRVIPILVDDCTVPGFLRGLARLDWRLEGESGILRIADQLREVATRR